MKPRFFATPAELRDWLHAHHESEPEVLIGLWKKHTGRAGVSIGEAVEEALCVGWIDGKGQQPRRGQLRGPLHAAPLRQRVERDQRGIACTG